MDPDRKQSGTPDVVDLRASEAGADATWTATDVRAVLESAADVIFSDGVSPEFLEQWTFETVQLLEVKARAATKRPRTKRIPAGRR